MERDSEVSRRGFLWTTATAGAGLIVAGCRATSSHPEPDNRKSPQKGRSAGESKGDEVTPTEDLMREHGALNRILLIYDELRRRLLSTEEFPPQVLTASADIIRQFIEDYHEKLEEDYLFTRFEKAGKLSDLVGLLRQQHDAGRHLTDSIMQSASAAISRDRAERGALAARLESFNRMYRPHEAREDTVLFPALRSIVSANEYDSLGEEFEKKEHELFGQDGFEEVVATIDGLEKQLGIEDLSRFTPQL